MNSATEQVVDTIKAMRLQETRYICTDYLHQQQQDVGGIPTIGPLGMHSVTVECREKMVQWCYKVVDFCNFNRETVSIAISVLDQFLASRLGNAVLHDRSQFQLAAMTALYLSVKTHEPEVMSAELVSTLSRGAHSQQEVEIMEKRILHALTWQVNPPTTLSFVREFLKLLPAELLDHDMRATLMEICKFQSELAVADYNLVVVGSSSIAYACLMNGLESLCMDRSILGYVSSILAQAAGLNLFSEQLVHVQIRLCQAVAQHTQPQAAPVVVHPKGHSPTTTAAGTHYGGACGRAAVNMNGVPQNHSSFKASPCSVGRMEI